MEVEDCTCSSASRRYSCRQPNSTDSSVGGKSFRWNGRFDCTVVKRDRLSPIRLLNAPRLFSDRNFLQRYVTDLVAATPEETLAKINQLPPAERQATLVREAKNERTVIWYAPMNRESLREFTNVFEAEYPFVKVEILTGGPQSLLNRIMTEYRAGKFTYDTMNVRSSALYTRKKANAVMRFDTPYRRVRAGFTDKEGYLNGIWASCWFISTTNR
jgi:hypothetical protein